MEYRHRRRHRRQSQHTAERGGTPLSGGRRTKDVGGWQSLEEKDIARTSAFGTVRRQTARLAKTGESRRATAHTNTLGCTLCSVIAVAVRRTGERRHERQRQKRDRKRLHEERHEHYDITTGPRSQGA